LRHTFISALPFMLSALSHNFVAQDIVRGTVTFPEPPTQQAIACAPGAHEHEVR